MQQRQAHGRNFKGPQNAQAIPFAEGVPGPVVHGEDGSFWNMSVGTGVTHLDLPSRILQHVQFKAEAVDAAEAVERSLAGHRPYFAPSGASRTPDPDYVAHQRLAARRRRLAEGGL